MESIENKLQNENISFNQEIIGYLLQTSKWGKFLAIVGFIGIGFLVIIALSIILGASFLSRFPMQGFPIGMLGFVYLLIALLYFFPINYLLQFSNQIRRGIDSSDSTTMTSAFRNLKSLFKFMGVLTIVVLSIYVVVLLIALPTMLIFSQV